MTPTTGNRPQSPLSFIPWFVSVGASVAAECHAIGHHTPAPVARQSRSSAAQRPLPERHGGACLRRAMFSTRNAGPLAAPTPPRSLPAGSDVQRQNVAPPRHGRHHAACLRGAMFPAGYRRPQNFIPVVIGHRETSPQGTSPHPDEPSGGGEARAEPHDLVLNMPPRWRAPWGPRKPGWLTRRTTDYPGPVSTGGWDDDMPLELRDITVHPTGS